MPTLGKSLIVMATALIAKLFLNHFFPIPSTTTSPIRIFNHKIFEQMHEDNKLYLAILGNVYDVSSGAKYYALGGSYAFFTGKDSSRSFSTGDFTNDLNDKIDDLTEQQVADIFNWKSNFDEKYIFLGHLEGAFYQSNGEKTKSLLEAEKKFKSHKKKEQKNVEMSSRFPSCNSQWSGDDDSSKVWCSTKSGGVERSWVGYPRLVFNSFHNTELCACVHEDDLNHPSVKEYKNCKSTSSTCEIKKK